MANSELKCPNVEIVFSGIAGGLVCQSVKQGAITSYPQLDIPIEEADERLMPHAFHAIDTGTKRIVILSSDTDVLVLALHFWTRMQSRGLLEMWMRAGVGNSTRYIPLHTMASNNEPLCLVLPAVHALTGCDSTSKVGTKLSALKADPINYLADFGKSLNDPNLEHAFTNAEEYLVHVLKPRTTCKTMDELRYTLYHQSKVSDIDELPPTSHATSGHLLRSLYTAHRQINCLTCPLADPRQYGFEEVEGVLKPVTYSRLYPTDIVQSCACQQCATKRCECRKNGVPCCLFCKCQGGQFGDSGCKNPFVLCNVPMHVDADN